MSRIKPADISKNPDLKAMFDMAEQNMGFSPEDGKIMAHNPDILNAVGGLVASVLNNGSVAPGTKRLIGFMTSQSSGCHYCSAHSSHGALGHGISEDQLNAIWEYESCDLFSNKEKAAIRVAHKAGMVPNATEQEDIDELKKYYTDAEVIEIVSTIGLYGFFNKFNHTLGTDIEEKPKRSYERVKKKR